MRAAFQRGPSRSEQPARALTSASVRQGSLFPSRLFYLIASIFLCVSGSVVINDRSGLGSNLIAQIQEKSSLAGVTLTESQESP